MIKGCGPGGPGSEQVWSHRGTFYFVTYDGAGWVRHHVNLNWGLSYLWCSTTTTLTQGQGHIGKQSVGWAAVVGTRRLKMPILFVISDLTLPQLYSCTLDNTNQLPVDSPVYFMQKIEMYFISMYMYFASICNTTVKKLKLVFKNAAKVIDPVVILFSADKEISGSLSVCVGWCCRGYLSISLYL